ncbi:hypothetical protein BDR03DRAFT_1012358 [Suillus americanus]|nr:hypothetical protein BDR03DRAFT_1012358 [Suillus americanus]
MAQSTPRVWLITGSSSGFGRAMVDEVLRNGEIAVATLRKPSTPSLMASQPNVRRSAPSTPPGHDERSAGGLSGVGGDVVGPCQGTNGYQFWGAVTRPPQSRWSGVAEAFGVRRKAALDSFTEVLAQEVLPAWNIRFMNPCWTRTPIVSSSMMPEPPALYASEPTAIATKIRAGFDAFIGSDALATIEVVTKRILSVTQMVDEYLPS